MRHYLLNQPILNRNTILRSLTFAGGATAATIYYSSNTNTGNLISPLPNPNNFLTADTTISVSIPHHLFSPSNSIHFLHHTPIPGHVPVLSRANDSASPPLSGFSSSVSAGEDEDRGKKCCSGCIDRYTISKAAATVSPAVVHLSVAQGFRGMSFGKSIGSGTIISSDGTILTCAHVVADLQFRGVVTKGKVDVTLQDGRTFEGDVVNADFRSDIAVVKIKSKTPLPTAKLGSSCKLIPGEPVLSLGCPLSLQNTVTAGIVSCVDRKSSDLGLGGLRREFLQTDCPINEGNSGGPLVNLDGEVVGVSTMKVSPANGLGFAVPSDSISKILEQFKKHGRVVRPWLGLKMLDLNKMIVAQLKERDTSFPDVIKGVLVPMVTPESPASRAGFLSGDVVIELEGRPVDSIREIIDIMGDKIGKPLKVVVRRANNSLVTLTVVPEEGYPDM